jgi:ferric-dicitrate binding protein FerR (iron transport regulator)
MEMAAKDKARRAAGAASSARANPYVQRLIEDEDLRNNIRTAFESARTAYARMTNGKPAHRAVFEDKKLQKELRRGAEALREASSSLREAPKKRRSGGFGRILLIAAVGAVLAVGLNEGLRSKVLDALFGSEEQFDYTSTTTPPTPAPEPAATT